MMDWPILEPPTWADRQTYGPRLSPLQFADMMYVAAAEPLAWRHIHFLATMMRENSLDAWARPIVWKPGDVAHLTVDRGVCALNSHWWGYVTDEQAYDPLTAIEVGLRWCESEAARGTRGAKPWDWGPILDWQWHGYQPDTVEYKAALSEARAAVSAVRADHGVTGL